jgi:zinc/manganese transport system ATP-binding protein
MTPVAFEDVTLALGGRDVLSRVSFEIRRNEFIGVLGPNGSGKTTLMRAILGLIRPTGGRISVFGEAPSRGNALIGYMPQTRSALAPRLRGRDFVAAVAGGHRWGPPLARSEITRDIDRVIALVGATSLARRPLDELSGGERQRLLLAQALLGRPQLLLLDEPLISLDPRHQSDVVELVRELQRTLECTVLFSAHELNPLLGALDRVLYLGSGGAAIGPVDAVITGPVLSRLYGTEIEVLRLHGRIFVMAGAHEVEHDSHRHAHA